MIKKVIYKKSLNDNDSADDLKYWLSRPAHKRILAVENYRKQFYGSLERLQRTARVIKRT
jgi:hypothetical protein